MDLLGQSVDVARVYGTVQVTASSTFDHFWYLKTCAPDHRETLWRRVVISTSSNSLRSVVSGSCTHLLSFHACRASTGSSGATSLAPTHGTAQPTASHGVPRKSLARCRAGAKGSVLAVATTRRCQMPGLRECWQPQPRGSPQKLVDWVAKKLLDIPIWIWLKNQVPKKTQDWLCGLSI